MHYRATVIRQSDKRWDGRQAGREGERRWTDLRASLPKTGEEEKKSTERMRIASPCSIDRGSH